MQKPKAIYPELTVARVSAAITCALAETQRLIRSGKAVQWNKGKASVLPSFKTTGMRKL